MTDRPPETPQGAPAPSDDPTRDIRLPPLSVRPAEPVPSAQDVPEPAPAPERSELPGSDATTVLEPRTGESAPFAEPLRQRTRPFGAPGDQVPADAGPESAGRSDAPPPPPAAAAAAPGPPARSGGRPWTWVVLAVLPVLVIVAAGVLLFLLLGGG